MDVGLLLLLLDRMDFNLDHCCLWMNLRSGSLIFGYLHLMKDFIQIVASLVILVVNVANRPTYFYENYISRNESTITYCAIFLTFGIVTLMFTVLLLNGLNQRKPEFVKAFLIYSEISTVIYFIICLVFICEQIIYILFVPGLLFLVIHIYCLLIIRSYYTKMDNSEVMSAIWTTPARPIVE